MRIHIVVLISILTVSMAFAQQTPAGSMSPTKEAFLKRSERVIQTAVESSKPNASEESNIHMAERIARDAPIFANQHESQAVEKFLPPAIGEHVANRDKGNRWVPKSEETNIIIFVSDSMPDAILRDAFQISADTNASVMFRGVRKGESIEKSFMRTSRIIAQMGISPKIQIDSRPFLHFEIKTVPTVVVFKNDDFVKVSGTLSVAYAMSRFAGEQFGDAGSRGTSFDIIEPDFLDEIADRMSKLDLKKKSEGMFERFWKNYKFTNLPDAVESKVFYFDPTVVNEHEIIDQVGNVIAPAGASYNPLDIVPYSKSIIVFDASNPKQLSFVKKTAQRILESGHGVVLLTTNVDRARGMNAYIDYNKELFPNRVFFLDDMFVSRFGIKAIPSVIKAEGRLFKIQQISSSEMK